MTKVNYTIFLIITFSIFSCRTDEKENVEFSTSLAALVSENSIKVDNVIACASGVKNDKNTVITYLYPRSGATDIRYYETLDIEVDKDNYQNYNRIFIEPTNLFNGYLKKFTQKVTQEKWVIITFFEDGILHLSNPIRLKHHTKPTEFVDKIEVDISTRGMPIFRWDDGIIKENKIYFQVVSNIEDNLLSGTYTFQKQFQYYKLNNVVLNITQDTPPQLDIMNVYNFTLMGVSEDNWVNLFVEKSFEP